MSYFVWMKERCFKFPEEIWTLLCDTVHNLKFFWFPVPLLHVSLHGNITVICSATCCVLSDIDCLLHDDAWDGPCVHLGMGTLGVLKHSYFVMKPIALNNVICLSVITSRLLNKR